MIVGISPWVRSDIIMVARIATIRPGARGRVPPGPALSSIRRSNILMINIMTPIYESYKLNLGILRKLYDRYISDNNQLYVHAESSIFRAFLEYISPITNDLLSKNSP